MSSYKLITNQGDFRSFKIFIAAKYSNVKIDYDESEFKPGETEKSKEFLKLSPLGKVPVLVTPKGNLLESNAIARFVASHRADTDILGASFFEKAQVDSWMNWTQNEIEVPACMVVYPIFGFLPPNPKQIGKGKNDLKNAMNVLENHLRSRSYMVGNKVTLADIVLVAALTYPFKMIFDAKQRSAFPSVTRWFMTMVAIPEFYDVLGDVDLAKKEQVPKKAEGKKKKDKKSKGAKKQEKQKAEKPKKVKKPKKPKHPLDMLPKSSMVLDVWKKTYSNSKPDYYKCMEWFWPNFDAEGYCLLTCAYKFQDENTVDWLTSNKIHCYIQRVDDVRKYSFGVMAVLDTKEAKGYYTVVGAWITRGDSAKYILEANEESSTFEWTKQDPAKMSDEEKKYIADLWCGEKLADGTAIYDQAVFK